MFNYIFGFYRIFFFLWEWDKIKYFGMISYFFKWFWLQQIRSCITHKTHYSFHISTFICTLHLGIPCSVVFHKMTEFACHVTKLYGQNNAMQNRKRKLPLLLHHTNINLCNGRFHNKEQSSLKLWGSSAPLHKDNQFLLQFEALFEVRFHSPCRLWV